MLTIIFWVCSIALLWAYAGYPATMLVYASLRRRITIRTGSPLPAVTVVLAVRNGASDLDARVSNLLEQVYPAHLLDVVVACNGSEDGSELLAATLAEKHPRVRALSSEPDWGKAGALNAGASAANGEIVVFADARQRFDRFAVRRLVRPFRDERVGGVTGRLVIQHSADPAVAGVSRYWQMETQLRLAESRTGSVVGATGAIYAIRRRLFEPLPQAVILDDVYLPLRIVRKGYRIAMAPRAVAFDRPSGNAAMEYRRRVRTMVGNYELIRLMPELLIPWRNPIFARYVSHKVLRILTPAFCVGSMVSAFMVGGTYTLFGLAMALMYILGALGMLIPVRALSIPSGFVLLHSAAVSALIRPFRSGAQVWAPQTR